MAKKIVAFLGSPRKGGNTDTLVSKMLSAAEEEGTEIEKVYLAELNIKPCRACEACQKKDPPKCVQTDDDFGAAAEKMKAADAFVFGTPIYWFNLSAQFKLFMDRWAVFVDKDWNSLLKGKSAAVVLCCGDKNIDSMTSPTRQIFRESLKFLGIDLVDCLAASAHAKGEVADNREAMEKAAEIGKKLSQ